MSSCIEIRSQKPREWYEEKYGKLPHDIYLLHKCDNPYCRNEEHLFLGSCKENVLDSVNKGRHSCFKNVHLAYQGNIGKSYVGVKRRTGYNRRQITSEDISLVRRLKFQGYRWGEIMRLSGRTSTTITRILRGEYD